MKFSDRFFEDRKFQVRCLLIAIAAAYFLAFIGVWIASR